MRIPDDVYLTRCRYCHHRRSGVENVEVPNDKLFVYYWSKNAPCDILGIAHCDRVPGECLNFRPNPMFGICQFCEFNNVFHDGYCTCPGGSVNKRRVFLGWSGGGHKNDYWGEHTLFTCDRYRVSEFWKDSIRQEVIKGRSPANFAPDTWKLVEEMEGSAVAREWSRLQAEERARATTEMVAKETQPIVTLTPDDLGQLSLFDAEDKR